MKKIGRAWFLPVQAGVLGLVCALFLSCDPVVVPRPEIEMCAGIVSGDSLSFLLSYDNLPKDMPARSVTGPSEKDISSGAYCNVFQLIAIADADSSRAIWDFDETDAPNAEGQYQLQIQVRRKRTYHILLLAGYKAEGSGDNLLLAAGYTKAQILNDTAGIILALEPLVVDIRFDGRQDGHPNLSEEPVKGQTLSLQYGYNWTAVFSMADTENDRLVALKAAEQAVAASPLKVDISTPMSFNAGSAINYTKTDSDTVTKTNLIASSNGQSLDLTIGVIEMGDSGLVAMDLLYSPFGYSPSDETWAAKYGDAAHFVTPLSQAADIPQWHIRNTIDSSGDITILSTVDSYDGSFTEIDPADASKESEITLFGVQDYTLAKHAFSLFAGGSIKDPFSKETGPATSNAYRLYQPYDETIDEGYVFGGTAVNGTADKPTVLHLTVNDPDCSIYSNGSKPLFDLNDASKPGQYITIILEKQENNSDPLTLDGSDASAETLINLGADCSFILDYGTVRGNAAGTIKLNGEGSTAVWGPNVSTGYWTSDNENWYEVRNAAGKALTVTEGATWTTDSSLATKIYITETDLTPVLKAPVVDVASQNSIIPVIGSNFTGSIVWTSQPYLETEFLSPGQKFSPRTVYTALLYLDANDGYIFRNPTGFAYNQKTILSHWVNDLSVKVYITFDATGTDAGSGMDVED
ncbi:MAG: hypothetical protein LBM77_00015 [Spirochaetaceae bacterium]|jgi:hypothetical protein|nr:hypothetical protein [Spirochaetaceae bacterium]